MDQIQETKGMTLQTKYLQNLKNLGHRYLSRVLFYQRHSVIELRIFTNFFFEHYYVDKTINAYLIILFFFYLCNLITFLCKTYIIDAITFLGE